MSITSLQLASPVALVVGEDRGRYMWTASASSVAVISSLTCAVAVGYVGIVAAIVAASALVTFCFAATRSRWVQRNLDLLAVERARERRESSRLRALRRATTSRQEQYLELSAIVAAIERSDPAEARRLELQELLEHFVRLVVGHQRCVEAMRATDGGDSRTTIPITDQPPSKYRREIAMRRLRQREEATLRLGRITDEIDSADDFIRLVAQRIACANLELLIYREDGQIDRRLAELDEVEAALVQISA